MFERFLRYAAALFCVSGLAGLAGCGASNENNGVKTPLPREGTIRVVNLLTDSGTMSSFLSNSVFGANQYGTATDLRPTLVGQYVMNILLTPPNNVTTTLVGNEPVDLTDPDEVSFFLIGTTTAPAAVRINNVEISYGINVSKTVVRPDYQILHAAVSSLRPNGVSSPGPADVYLTDANDPNAAQITNLTPTVAGLNFGEHTALAKLDAAVTYRLRVTRAGEKTVLYDSGGFTRAAGQRSIFTLMDNYGSDGVSLRVANITAAGAEHFANETLQGTWRVTNAIPDVASIDVYLGDPTSTSVVFPSVGYGDTTSPYVVVANGAQTVNVTAAGDPNKKVIATKSITFVGGDALGVYASGLALPTTPTATVAGFTESQRAIAGQSQVRFVNASPLAASIDLYLLVPGQSVGDVSAVLVNGGLLSTTSLNLTPGPYDLVGTRTGTTVQLFGPDRIDVEDGKVYSAVLLDAAGGGLTLQFNPESIPQPPP